MYGDICGAFEGNPEFYGLGIRLGVYLQIISSWVTNSLNDNTIADTHAANSIFLLAIVAAVVNAAKSEDIRPVEVWIMLQICLMFPLTVLGIFGVRTNLLTTSTIANLYDRLKKLSTFINVKLSSEKIAQLNIALSSSRVETSSELVVYDRRKVDHVERGEEILPPDINAAFTIRHFGIPVPNLNLSFKALSLLKHFRLSWTSAIWRTLILCLLTATNLWFWFSYWDQSSCGYSIFLFANIQSSSALATFFKVGAVIFALAAIVPLLASTGFLVIWARYAVDLVGMCLSQTSNTTI